MAWLTKIGFVDYWNNVLEPLSYALYDNPFLAAHVFRVRSLPAHPR